MSLKVESNENNSPSFPKCTPMSADYQHKYKKKLEKIIGSKV